jgi:hypothetical protein
MIGGVLRLGSRRFSANSRDGRAPSFRTLGYGFVVCCWEGEFFWLRFFRAALWFGAA